MAADDTDNRTLRKSRWTPYLLSFPGLLCLYLFFLVPLVTLLKIALSVPVERGSSLVDFTLGVEQLLQGLHRLRRATVARARVRRGRHRAVHRDRLPAGVLHRLQGGPVAEPAARSRHGAVLHELPAPHDRLAVAVRRQRSGAQRRPRHSTSSASLDFLRLDHRRQDHEHLGGGDRRPHLQLLALRPAPDLRQPREDPDQPDRRRGRPVLELRAHVPHGDLPALAARACSPARC